MVSLGYSVFGINTALLILKFPKYYSPFVVRDITDNFEI